MSQLFSGKDREGKNQSISAENAKNGAAAPKLRTTMRIFPQSSTNFLPIYREERGLPVETQQGDHKNSPKRSLPVEFKQGNDERIHSKKEKFVIHWENHYLRCD